jgi:hypothetical protein
VGDRAALSLAQSHLSTQTSSIRQLLKMLFSIKVNPFTSGCQQVPWRMKKMIGRTASSISLRSTCHTGSAFRPIGFRRLPVDQGIHLGIAAGIIARRPARVILVELRVGVVDAHT